MTIAIITMCCAMLIGLVFVLLVLRRILKQQDITNDSLSRLAQSIEGMMKTSDNGARVNRF